jgi:hypothetical protein
MYKFNFICSFFLKLLDQGEFKLTTYFIYIYNASDRKQTKRGMSENVRSQGREEMRLETAVSESRPDVQDDIQAIDEQQEEEIWIDPGMKAHPVAHWDGLDDEEEDIEYTDNEDDLGDLEYKEINAFTLLIKSKEKDQNCLEVLKRGKGRNKMNWL